VVSGVVWCGEVSRALLPVMISRERRRALPEPERTPPEGDEWIRVAVGFCFSYQKFELKRVWSSSYKYLLESTHTLE
jgi:hypothetical protein